MYEIREIIFTACMCAVIGTAAKLLTPSKFCREMRLICTLLLVICIAARVSRGFKLDLSSIFTTDDTRRAEYAQTVLSDTENALAARLSERLTELGINDAETRIVCTYDEYNYVRAEKVYIHLHTADESTIPTAKNAAAELFPGCETEVTAYERNEHNECTEADEKADDR